MAFIFLQIMENTKEVIQTLQNKLTEIKTLEQQSKKLIQRTDELIQKIQEIYDIDQQLSMQDDNNS